MNQLTKYAVMSKEDKVKVFIEEINAIRDVKLRDYAKLAMELVPSYIFEVPSTSSGSFHPPFDLGVGGNVRHTKAVFQMVIRLGGTFNLKSEHLAVAQTAALFHDSFKYGFEYDPRYYSLHPLLPRVGFKGIKSEVPADTLEAMFRAIENHMGPLNGTNMSTWGSTPQLSPTHAIQQVVHLADYVVSDVNYVDKRFVEFEQPSSDRKKHVPLSMDIVTDFVELGIKYSGVEAKLEDVIKDENFVFDIKYSGAPLDIIKKTIQKVIRESDNSDTKPGSSNISATV